MRKVAYVSSSPAARAWSTARHALSPAKILIALALAIVLVVVVVIQGATSPGFDPNLQALEGLPAYALTYPDATALSHINTPVVNKQGIGAKVTRYFGFKGLPPPTVDTTVQAIVAWYNNQLQPRGWQQQRIAIPATDLETAQWTRQCVTATLHIYQASAVHDLPAVVDTKTYPFVFAFALQRTCAA